MLDQISFAPERGPKKANPAVSGTSVIISDLTENWTESRVKEMADYDFARLSDPFADAGKRPRIAIYWNGERISIPMMQAALLDAAHARVSGKYDIVRGKPVLTCTVEAIDLGYANAASTKAASSNFSREPESVCRNTTAGVRAAAAHSASSSRRSNGST
jgi:hypothetical protein